MILNPFIPTPPYEFIEANLGLVHDICRRYLSWIDRNRTLVDYDDLFSVGSMGLLKAYETYDPSSHKNSDGDSCKFSTYATYVVLGYVRKFMASLNPSFKVSYRVKKLASLIMKHNLIESSTEKIAERFAVSVSSVEYALEYLAMDHLISLSTPTSTSDGSDGVLTLEDSVADEYVDPDRQIVLDSFLDTLDSRQRIVVDLLQKGLSQTEVGSYLGISQVHVGRIFNKILASAKAYGESNLTCLVSKPEEPKMTPEEVKMLLDQGLPVRELKRISGWSSYTLNKLIREIS